jgi:hypothetical protein
VTSTGTATGTSTSAPGIPTGVSISASSGQITISWNAVTGATSYNIYWATTSGVNTSSTKIAGANSPYIHTGRTNGTTYYYKVSAVIAGNESGLSTEVSSKFYGTPSFTDNSNGTVMDFINSLVWKKCSQGQNNDSTCSGTALTYRYCTTNDNACDNGTIVTSGPLYDTCNSLNTNPVGGFAGRTTWRVPTKTELETLVSGISEPYINQSMFPNTKSFNYWSSTVDNSSLAWAVRFSDGTTFAFSIYKYLYYYYARCVSTGP